jgi:hypothetical protein
VNPVSVSIGGGINSTGLVCGKYERGEPIDLNLFSDPGAEKPETYRHIERLESWLVARGYPGITIVRHPSETLEEQCLRQKTLPSIVVGFRSCSDHFKIRPQNHFLKQWQPAIDAWERGERVTKLVGFDAGEPHRAKDFSDKRYEVRFPLIEWNWDRDDCIAAIKRHGLEVPPKSSCFFCPEMREWEVLELRDNNPELFKRALAMEANNLRLVTIKGLARTYSWKQLADYDKSQLTLLPPRADRMPCVCFDGE